MITGMRKDKLWNPLKLRRIGVYAVLSAHVQAPFINWLGKGWGLPDFPLKYLKEIIVMPLKGAKILPHRPRRYHACHYFGKPREPLRGGLPRDSAISAAFKKKKCDPDF